MGGVLEGRRGLVMGVANERSIGWGIAQAARREGAELAFTYVGEAIEKRVRPLAARWVPTSSFPATFGPTRT